MGASACPTGPGAMRSGPVGWPPRLYLVGPSRPHLEMVATLLEAEHRFARLPPSAVPGRRNCSGGRAPTDRRSRLVAPAVACVLEAAPLRAAGWVGVLVAPSAVPFVRARRAWRLRTAAGVGEWARATPPPCGHGAPPWDFALGTGRGAPPLAELTGVLVAAVETLGHLGRAGADAPAAAATGL